MRSHITGNRNCVSVAALSSFFVMCTLFGAVVTGGGKRGNITVLALLALVAFLLGHVFIKVRNMGVATGDEEDILV